MPRSHDHASAPQLCNHLVWSVPGGLSSLAVGPIWKVGVPVVVLDPVGLFLVVSFDGRGGHGGRGNVGRSDPRRVPGVCVVPVGAAVVLRA